VWLFLVEINAQFVTNGSPSHLPASLGFCKLAIELSRNLVTGDLTDACTEALLYRSLLERTLIP
jgi:hypothetical protein